MKQAVKGIEYDMHSDSCYDMPECPECGMPLFGLEESDIGKTIQHDYCETEVYIPDEEWIHKYFEDNTGSRTEEIKCMWCGGRMSVVKRKRCGKWVTGHGECLDCGVRFIV